MKSDNERRVTALAALAVTYNREASEAFFHAYNVLGLADVATGELERAIGMAVRTLKFMPSVSELRELVSTSGLKADDRAVLAWKSLEDACRKHGVYRSVVFEDAATNAAVHMLGGWVRLCDIRDGENQSKPDDWDTWTRKRFLDVYTAILRAGFCPELAAPLIGLHDARNATDGRTEAVREPALIPMPAQIRQSISGPRLSAPRPARLPAHLDLVKTIGRMP